MPDPVDLRGLDPPDPLLRILEVLEDGASEGPHVFLLSREPWPLYGLLDPRWKASTRREGEGVVLTVCRRADRANP